MIEQLTVVDASRRPIGKKDRDSVHLDGDWHETFHCWFWKDDNLYLQLRSPEKKDFPGKLDITAAGHLAVGEDATDGVREIEEELGIRVEYEQLHSLGVFEDVIEADAFTDREFAHTYAYRYRGETFHLDTEEVTDIVIVKRKDLIRLIQGQVIQINVQSVLLRNHYLISTDALVPHAESYWAHVLEGLTRLASGS